MNLLSDFTILSQDLIDKTFEISDKAEEHIYTHEESTMKWGRIRNFYKDPVAVTEFLQKFPVVPQDETHSPGLQQHFPMPLMKCIQPVYQYLYGVLERNEFMFGPPNASDWQTYCNTHWTDMKVNVGSMIPHTDQFNMAFNIWLSEDNPAGTEFYLHDFGEDEPVAYYLAQFASYEKEHLLQKLIRTLNSNDNFSDEWNPDEIDTFFSSRNWKKYLTMDAEYNSCTFYPGHFFHKPEWDPRSYKKDLLRYSQVISYRFMNPGPFQSEWWQNFMPQL
jgi:hypothetical protein|tara:strand:- start:91 stop:918 length:828 start_codon:yes stop_codon:yes gene_type:complete